MPPQSLLTHAEFYVLLTLHKASLHAYALRQAAINASRGSLKISPGQLHRMLWNMVEDGLVESLPPEAGARSRQVFNITISGSWALKVEMIRISELAKVGRDLGLIVEGEEPLDIQYLRYLEKILPRAS